MSGVEGLQQDDKIRLYTDLGPDFSIGLHWYDTNDCKDNLLSLRTDVIAKLQANGSEGEIPFWIVSISQGSDYQSVENPLCAANLQIAFQSIKQHIDDYMQPLHEWHIHIVDTPDGPALAANSTADRDVSDGDPFGSAIVARTEEDALQFVMNNAKTSAVEAMASAGLLSLIGHPAAAPGPRYLTRPSSWGHLNAGATGTVSETGRSSRILSAVLAAAATLCVSGPLAAHIICVMASLIKSKRSSSSAVCSAL